MNFWQIVAVIKLRKRVIIGLMAITTLVILLAAPKPKVTYEAVCYMSPTPQAMQGGAAAASDSSQNNQGKQDRDVTLSNLVLLAESGGVYQRAIDFLALPEDEQRKIMPGLPAYKHISRITTAPGKELEAKDWKDVLQCSPVENKVNKDENTTTTSDIIRLRMKMENGDDVIYLANAVGVAFSEEYGDKSHEEMKKYIEFLVSGTDEAHKTLLDVESRMADYQKAHKTTGAEAEVQNAVSSQAALQSQRNAAQADLESARSALQDIDKQLAQQPLVQTDKLPADMNPKVIALNAELTQAESDLRQLAIKYKPTHAAYQAQESRVRLLKQQIANEGLTYNRPTMSVLHDELMKQRSQLSNQYKSAAARFATLNKQFSGAEQNISTLAGTQKEIVELNREHQRAQEEFTLFSTRLAQARIADREYEKYGSIIPFEWARTPVGPIVDGPRKRTLVIYGLILSLIFGVGICVWYESIDNRIRNVEDVERLLQLPSVGVIPAIEGKTELPKLTHMFPLSAAAESYRILRTNILFAQRDNPFKTLMSATSKPGQGATTTICNLAISLAQTGKKIILIDADLRRPALHKFFDLSNEVGLSTMLRNQVDPITCMKKTEVPNLIIIPAGPPPLNPSELLGSIRMQEIVKRLEEQCDMVLFDTPSTVVFSDGPILASWLDAVLFVMSADQVPRGTEHKALETLRRANSNIIGVVVNRIAPENIDNCQFYSHYYHTSNMDTDIYSLAEGESHAEKQIGPGEQSGKSVEPASAEPKVVLEADQVEDDNPFPE